MVLLRVPRAGPPHRGEGDAPGEGPAAALRGVLCRREGAQMQKVRRHPSRQDAAGGVGEDLMMRGVRRMGGARPLWRAIPIIPPAATPLMGYARNEGHGKNRNIVAALTHPIRFTQFCISPPPSYSTRARC